MTVNVRAKGARGETLVRDLLRKHSGLGFERVPCSGALPYLKGDLYVPHYSNRFCIEVKNYAESHFNDKIFTSKTNNLVLWWNKLQEQAKNSTSIKPVNTEMFVDIRWLSCYIILAEEWLEKEKIKWSK
jgi:Holliday junction resolvase